MIFNYHNKRISLLDIQKSIPKVESCINVGFSVLNKLFVIPLYPDLVTFFFFAYFLRTFFLLWRQPTSHKYQWKRKWYKYLWFNYYNLDVAFLWRWEIDGNLMGLFYKLGHQCTNWLQEVKSRVSLTIGLFNINEKMVINCKEFNLNKSTNNLIKSYKNYNNAAKVCIHDLVMTIKI